MKRCDETVMVAALRRQAGNYSEFKASLDDFRKILNQQRKKEKQKTKKFK